MKFVDDIKIYYFIPVTWQSYASIIYEFFSVARGKYFVLLSLPLFQLVNIMHISTNYR